MQYPQVCALKNAETVLTWVDTNVMMETPRMVMAAVPLAQSRKAIFAQEALRLEEMSARRSVVTDSISSRTCAMMETW